ncbi:hypothetical protein [Parachlamydia acanthamoebae]|uniref:hypothetical protein n=1 Tax=Parachlamydia acanthamoebae TaxID=83552 RepID=UPI0001C177D3|nr:hypothetical protein [Parachlamydia acanthamoebae]EFB40279.1 hypothetical protein pah_c212o022 [Parachlamydia acanthamoebae str. Hall's coccus]
MNTYDWYDCDKVKEFNKKRSNRMRSLVKKISEAKAKGNEQEINKAYSNLIKYQKQEETYRKKAEGVGHCWV